MEDFMLNWIEVLLSFLPAIFFCAFITFFVYSVKKNAKSTGLPLDDKDYELLNITKPE
jgi:hypothetical protein